MRCFASWWERIRGFESTPKLLVMVGIGLALGRFAMRLPVSSYWG